MNEALGRNATPESEGEPALLLSQFGVSFGRRVVLASLDLRIPLEGATVLMGPVKTGKSTLLRSLAWHNQANSLHRSWGRAELLGQPIGPAWMPSLVAQHASLLRGSAGEALAFHIRQRGIEHHTAIERRIRVERALAEAHLGRHVRSIDQPMLELPTSIQRAVGILSLALAENRLLLIDEPTYGLSEQEANWLIEWLAELGRHRRLLVALHHQGQARRLAARIVLIGGGRVLGFDDSPRFFTHPENAWVEQFIRTGSLSIASPDAKPEELNPDVPPPPPLPPEALAAIAPFETPRELAPEPAPPPPSSSPRPEPAAVEPEPPMLAPDEPIATPPEPPTAIQTAAAVAEDDPSPHAEASTVEAAAPPAAPARPIRPGDVLPPISRHGVTDAAGVGRNIVSEYRGPQGFHWILPGRLAGCAEPGVSTTGIDYDLDLLKRVGVTHLITLTEKDLDQPALSRNGLRNLHLPINDREAPTIAQAYMLVRRMQLLLDKGEVVAVHCKAGIGRTGTMLASWLIREGGLGAVEAIQRLRAINPSYVQSKAQEDFLVEFENDLVRRL